MITAEKLAVLTSYTAPALANAIRNAGYQGYFFISAQFVGLTNGNQFCYRVKYKDENQGGVAVGKVFLTYCPGGPLHESSITAEF